VFFDVGANEGQTSRSVLAEFSAARVVAFEPHPRIFVKLLQNLDGETRFIAHTFAISDTNWTSPFYEYGSSLLNSLIPDGRFLSFGFRLIATYSDYIDISRELHVGANALFALPPTDTIAKPLYTS